MDPPRPGLRVFGTFFPASIQPQVQPQPEPEPQLPIGSIVQPESEPQLPIESIVQPEPEPQLPIGSIVQPAEAEPNQLSPDHSSGAPKRRRTNNTRKQQATKRRVSNPVQSHKPTHIFTRALFKSDVDTGLNRLTIPRNQILAPFLTDLEEAELRDLNGIEVKVVDSLGVRPLNLARWNYKNSSGGECSWSYALNGGWIDLVKRNGFAIGDTIQVWSFRNVNGDLGFIVFKEDARFLTDNLLGNANREISTTMSTA